MKGHLSLDTRDTCPKGQRDRTPFPYKGVPVPVPRLLDLHGAAAYCGVSYWTLRDWVLADYLPTIDLPPLRAREGDRQKTTLRRVLIDRNDLDSFIEGRKRRAAACPVTGQVTPTDGGTR
jgi:hypothetical protein